MENSFSTSGFCYIFGVFSNGVYSSSCTLLVSYLTCTLHLTVHHVFFCANTACDTENDSNKTILKIEQPWNFYDTWTSRMDWLSSVIQDCISLSYNFRMKSHMTCWVHCCQRKSLQVSLTNQWERHNTTVTFLDFVAGHVPGPEKEPAFQPLLLSIASSSSGTQTFPWVSSK